jgi:isopenicillin N synthase-like dioxygenase
MKNVCNGCILLDLLVFLPAIRRVHTALVDNPVVPVIDLGPWLSERTKDTVRINPHNNGQSHSPSSVELKEEQQDVVNQIQQACRHVGFFMIKNHGFNQSIMDNAWKASHDFFSLSTEEKMMHKTTDEAEYPYGYEQSETLAKGKQIDSDKDQRIHMTDLDCDRCTNNIISTIVMKDLKETFAIGPNNPNSGMPPRRWVQSPNVPPNFQDAVESYYRHMEALSLTLLEILALALNQDILFFEKEMDHHLSALRLAHYFPLDNTMGNTHLVRAGAHTDYGVVTILAAQDKGLEVLLDGKWDSVPFTKDALIVNVGDLMQRWTNDKWTSTMHRVVMPSTGALEERYSMAFFVNVNGETVIQPLSSCLDDDEESSNKYPSILAREHLMAKHLASMGEAIVRAESQSVSDEL